jgi:YD repeat-containing protein
MKKWILANLSLLFFAISSNSQNLKESANISVIPPSPDVARLNQYIDIPVSTATGIPSINVPFFQIKTNGINIPIGLNYHAGGFKVEDIASSFGLGWTLSNVFQISRSMSGLPDEDPMGYLNNGPLLTSLPNPIQDPMLFQKFIKYINNEEDTEPDMFYFSTPSESGKFLFDKNGSINFLPHKMVKIAPSNSLDSWKVVSETGMIYKFSSSEFTTSIPHNIRGQVQTFKSAWLLDTIFFPNSSNFIAFEYINTNIEYLTSFNYTVAHPISPGANNVPYPDVLSRNRNSNSVKLISKIIFPEGTVDFIYNGSNDPFRCDVSGGKYLKEIVLKNLNDQLVKKVKLFYSYFTENGTLPLGISCLGLQLTGTHRLKLEKVQELSNNESEVLETSFVYNEDVNLPPRISLARDHWGYYNGANNNTLVPAGIFKTQYHGKFDLAGADRNSNHLFVGANVLKKIKYPTGGESNFIFEGNTCQNNYLPNTLIDRSIVRTFSEINASNNIIITPSCTEARSYGPDISIKPLYMPNQVRITIKIYNHLNDLIKEKQYINPVHGDPNPLEPLFVEMNNNFPFRIESIISHLGNTIIDNNASMLEIKWQDEQIDFNKKVGGIRIKQIEFKDNSTNNLLTKKFEYTDLQNNSHSSGTVLNVPIYHYERFHYDEHEFLFRTGTSNIDLGYLQGSPVSYNRVLVSSVNSNPNLNNGYSEFIYYGNKDFQDYNEMDNISFSPTIYVSSVISNNISFNTPSLIYPFIPPKYNNEWRRGLLREEIVGSINNTGQKIPIKKKKLTYKFYSQELPSDQIGNFGKFIKGAKAFKMINKDCNVAEYLTPSYGCGVFGYKTYSIYTGAYYSIDTVKEIHYNNNLSLEVNTVNTFNNLNLQLIKTSTKNSKGEENISNFYYPQDFPSNLVFLDMFNKNIISKPVKQVQSLIKGGTTATPLNTTELNYSNFSNYLQMSSVQSSIGTGPLNTDIEINAYDAKANVLQTTEKNGIITTYIYGYNSQYPVAKIVGTTWAAANAVFTSADLAIINNPAATDVQMRNVLNNLRTSLPNTFVTTYTYKPLIGVTSETDPNGKTKYYEYDSFNRLKLIRDFNGNILKTFDYKYKQTY